MFRRIAPHALLAVILIIGAPVLAQMEETTYHLTQSQPNLEIWTTPTTSKVYPDSPVPDTAGGAIKVYAARNEFESFQVVVRPSATQNLTLTLDSFGSGITAEIYQVRYLDITDPSDGLGWAGEHPDPLWPLDNGASVTAPGGRNTTFWITLKIPADVAAGDYSANCNVGGVTVPVILHVFNFTLSPEHHVTAEVNLSMPTIMAYYGVPGVGTEYWEYVEMWNQFLIDHRLTPRNPMWPGALVTSGGEPYIEYDCDTHQLQDPHDIWGFEIPAAKYLDGNGFNDGTGFPRFRLNGFTNNEPSVDQRPFEFCGQNRSAYDWFEYDNPSSPYNQAWFTYITALNDYLDDLGYLSRANFCISGEVTNEFHQDAMAWYTRYLKEAAPDLPLMVTSPPVPEITGHQDYLNDGQVDIWLTSLAQHDPAVALDRLENHGEESWLYFQSFDLNPRFNPLTIDHPGMDSCLLGWYLWRYRMSGFSHWSVNSWSTNPWTTPAYQSNNGYLSLLYPPSQDNSPIMYGANGHRPVPSLRLELLRDGLEDYEYLVAYNGGQGPVAGVESPIDEQVALLVGGVSAYNRDDHFRANLRRLIGMVVGGEIAELPAILPQSSHPRAQGDPGDYYLNFQDPAGEPLDEPLVFNGHEYFKIGAADYDAVAGYGWYAETIANWQTTFLASGPNPLQRSILYSDWGRPAVFEFDLPSGNYDVTVSVGWEGRTYGHQQIFVEGVPFVADESVTGYLVRTEEVSVQDSRLTLAMGLPDEYTMLNYVEIEAVDDLSAVYPNTPPLQVGARLHPAWPNPCNPSTTIRFDLPRRGATDLCVYDLAGRRVRQLIAGQVLEAGRQEVEWIGQDDRGRGVAAGVYFIRLEFEGAAQTERVAVVK